jgi:hypothetical protein
MSISFLLDQNPNIASVGFGGAVVERAEIKLGKAWRSGLAIMQSLFAPPSV